MNKRNKIKTLSIIERHDAIAGAFAFGLSICLGGGLLAGAASASELQQISGILTFLVVAALCMLGLLWVFCCLATTLLSRCFVVVFILVILGMSHSSVPVLGWDALDFWVKRTVAIVEGDAGNTALLPSRHGLAFSGFLAHFRVGSDFFGLNFEAAVALLLWFQSFLLLSSLLSFSEQPHLGCGTFCCVLVLSMPLFENHFSVIGYAETWLMLVLLSLVVQLFIVTKRGLKLISLLNVIGLSLVAVTVKSSGIIFIAIIGFALLYSFSCHISWLKQSSWPRRGMIIFACVCVGFLVAYKAYQNGSEVKFIQPSKNQINFEIPQVFLLNANELDYVILGYASNTVAEDSFTPYEILRYPGRKLFNGPLEQLPCNSNQMCTLNSDQFEATFYLLEISLRTASGRPVWHRYACNQQQIAFAINDKNYLCLGGSGVVTLGGRSSQFSLAQSPGIFLSIFVALFCLSSFSLIPLFVLCSIVFNGKHRTSDKGELFLLSASLCSLTTVLVGGAFASYLIRFGPYVGDTVFSRTFLVGLIICTPHLLLSIERAIVDDKR